jgi:hypothetical protein
LRAALAGLVLPAALALAPAAHAATPARWEFRTLAGAGLDANPHGELDVGLRSGAFSAELFTDTLDLRWQPQLPRGRAWLAARGVGFAGAMLITPYDQPDSVALMHSLAVLEGGALGWLPHGFYAGGGGRAAVLAFGERETTAIPVPVSEFVGGPLVAAGWWSPGAQAELRGGVDFAAPLASTSEAELATLEAAFGENGAVGAAVQPWAEVEARWRSRAFVAPRVELRGGWSEGRGAATSFRAGGSMPYQVPLVGYGWSSQWLTAYGAARAGLFVGSADAAPGSGVGAEMVGEPTNRLRGRIGVVADVLAGQELPREEATVEAGLGLGGGLRWRRAWVVGEGGCSLLATPSPAECAGMIRLGVDWFPLGRR